MKEFIDKPIEKIVNTPTKCLDTYSISCPDIITGVKNGIEYGCASRQNEIIDIVNELAEEYKVSEMPTGSEDCCEWVLIDYDANVYDTTCRNPHILLEGSPTDNSYEFCPYCGKEIKVAPYTEGE